MASEPGGALSGMAPARYQSVQLRCAFCDQLVEARNGAAGKVFICFDCVDAINRLRADTQETSPER